MHTECWYPSSERNGIKNDEKTMFFSFLRFYYFFTSNKGKESWEKKSRHNREYWIHSWTRGSSMSLVINNVKRIRNVNELMEYNI